MWQSLINLALIAERKPDEIFENREAIIDAVENGSVITVDNGIKTLSKVAAADKEYNQVLFPYLIEKLRNCRPKSVAQFAKSIMWAVNDENRAEYLVVLTQREGVISPSQQRRVKKILNKFEYIRYKLSEYLKVIENKIKLKIRYSSRFGGKFADLF